MLSIVLAVVEVIALGVIVALVVVLVVQGYARRPKARPGDHDAEILAVAQEGLEAAPELADDAEAVARTVLALNEAIRAEAARDAAGAAFVTPGHARLDGFLAELFPRTKDAPKEKL